MPDLTNKEFGDYFVLRLIGRGAMAEVYLAEQRSLSRRVALKLLKQELAEDQTYTKRFVREAKAIAKLSHPNLVQVFQADCLNGHWFIAQEYVQGQTLQQVIRRNGPLSAKRVADILWQCSSALEKARQEGVIHRDIKPDNILLADNGELKIADFGLARLVDAQDAPKSDSVSLTQIGMTLGTPLYMSPEQAQGKPLDHRSDIYSLGITCYHALAGQPPFRGDNALAVVLQHVNKKPQSLEKIRKDIPPSLARIVHRMIEKDPKRRFQHFTELQQELRTLYTLHFHDDEAPLRLTGWNLFRASPVDEQVIQTTSKLQRAMQLASSFDVRVWRRGIFLVLFATTMLCFGVLGYWQNQAQLLPKPAEPFVKKETVAEQWVFACQNNTPEAWRHLLKTFPAEEYWCRKAKRQMIQYYFQENDSVSPLIYFYDLAYLSDAEIDDRALGIIGLAWSAAEDGNKGLVYEYLEQYSSMRPSHDELLKQLYETTLKKLFDVK